MKKRKKLALHRETIRTLEGGTVLGGGPASQTSCACDAPTGCDCETLDTGCYSPTMCVWGCSIRGKTCRC